MTDETRESLENQLKITSLSQQTIVIIIYAIILNLIQVNKIRVTILDELNGTNYAKDLPNTEKIPFISSVLIVYASYIFLYIAYITLIQGINATSNSNTGSNNNSSGNNINGLYDSYLASAFVFVAALIRLSNINTTSEELEVDF